MQKESIKKHLLINERISIKDVIFKYTLRDLLLGSISFIPASIGIALRMVIFKPFLRSCGKGLIMKHLVTIKFPERVSIGSHVGISEYTLIDGDGGISIGDYVRIASHVSIIAFSHNYKDPATPIKLQGKLSKGISIGDDCWIGTGVRILDGVILGKGSVVGAGSIVTKNIPEYSVAVGSPARVVKKREQI